MPRSEPFEAHADRYDRWFEQHEADYRAELAALEPLVADVGPGLEVGVGTGRFAAPLGVEIGLDPARAALSLAHTRGVEPVRGVAERLPFADGRFRTVLVVTTVCFVDDLRESVQEARRVLRTDGSLVLGSIDRDSPLGQQYESRKQSNSFFRAAMVRTTEEILERLAGAGFDVERTVQTLFSDAPQDAVREGHGERSFVGISATPD